MRLTIDIDDMQAGAFQEAMAEAGRRCQDMTPLMDSIGVGLSNTVRERFAETSVAPDGTPWKPSRRAQDGGGRTLLKSGNLSDSITHQATANSMSLGTNVLYAAVHQFGATIKAKTAKSLRFKVGDKWVFAKSVTIPARPFIGISEDDEEMILGEATDWLAGAFEGHGG